MVSRLKRILRFGFNFAIAGRLFKLYAPQSPPEKAERPRKLAICDLIPHLGDKVMIFPLLDALRRENPDLEISYFTSGAGRLIGLHPAVDHLYSIARRPKKGLLPRPFFFDVIGWWRRDLRPLRFHTVVVVRGGVEPWFSHHLAWLLGGKARVAYSPELEPERWESQFGISPLLTAEVREMHGIHEVSRASEVLQLAGLLKKPVDIQQPVESMVAIARSEKARDYLASLGLANRPYAVIGPGASLPRRAWPARDFAELARLEFLSRGWRTVIVGGPEIAEAAETISKYLGGDVLNLSGKTDFEQLTAVCGRAQCFIGNDSGTTHVAGACGVPSLLVTAFASGSRPSHHASPLRSHPLGPWVAIVQPEYQLAPCTTECVATELHCLAQVSVEMAQRALQQLIQEAESSGREKLSPHEGTGVSR
ncbi:hypothetical protein GCM10011507_19810 [Edaphobacter acidisoli]|uniref:Glycosyltransferase family 9 protein n=1 Tax=Edaphobacter acidisoli TaxID=2040573 RepID=A0A916RUS6_9BACT|nr:glycosyltransferase family 9 protein [Edaphobacter acidisoli]GGA68323.1 hypothetical protein GCM10011507_19810 [Edaphobacter acidisoli]